jgi:hypothetical protein
MQRWIKWPLIYNVPLENDEGCPGFLNFLSFFSRCEYGIIEECTPTSNTKCKTESNHFFVWLYSLSSHPHHQIWTKVNWFWLSESTLLCLTLKIPYFHIKCPMFHATGSRYNHLWWLLLVPISIVVGEFLTFQTVDWIRLKYFICMCENRMIKSIKNFKKEENKKE